MKWAGLRQDGLKIHWNVPGDVPLNPYQLVATTSGGSVCMLISCGTNYSSNSAFCQIVKDSKALRICAICSSGFAQYGLYRHVTLFGTNTLLLVLPEDFTRSLFFKTPIFMCLYQNCFWSDCSFNPICFWFMINIYLTWRSMSAFSFGLISFWLLGGLVNGKQMNEDTIGVSSRMKDPTLKSIPVADGPDNGH